MARTYSVGQRKRSRLADGNGEGNLDELMKDFVVLEDGPSILPKWLEIVSKDSISGARCQDANHAASAKVHEVDRVLTFDRSDFERFPTAGLTAVHPKDV